MKTNVLAVYDRVTKQYDRLFTTRNLERIQEEFDVICSDPKVSYSRNPQEYEIHLLGTFNDSPHHDPEINNSWLAQPRIVATGKPFQNQNAEVSNANS